MRYLDLGASIISMVAIRLWTRSESEVVEAHDLALPRACPLCATGTPPIISFNTYLFYSNIPLLAALDEGIEIQLEGLVRSIYGYLYAARLCLPSA
jgi:hypothetical protein